MLIEKIRANKTANLNNPDCIADICIILWFRIMMQGKYYLYNYDTLSGLDCCGLMFAKIMICLRHLQIV